MSFVMFSSLLKKFFAVKLLLNHTNNALWIFERTPIRRLESNGYGVKHYTFKIIPECYLGWYEFWVWDWQKEGPLLNLDHVSTVCLWNILYFVLMRDNILTKWQRTNEVTAGVRAPANQAWAALAACHAMTVTSVATEEEGRRVINAMANDQPQQSCY